MKSFALECTRSKWNFNGRVGPRIGIYTDTGHGYDLPSMFLVIVCHNQLTEDRASILYHYLSQESKMEAPLSLVHMAFALLRLSRETLLQNQPDDAQEDVKAALRSYLTKNVAHREIADISSYIDVVQKALAESGDGIMDNNEDHATVTVTTTTSANLLVDFSDSSTSATQQKSIIPFCKSPSPKLKDHRDTYGVHGAGKIRSTPLHSFPTDPLAAPSLLTEIFSFLGTVAPCGAEPVLNGSGHPCRMSAGPGSETTALQAVRVNLAPLLTVARLWRATASQDRFWRPIVSWTLPRLTMDAKETRTWASSITKPFPYRQAFLRYARCLALPVVGDGEEWHAHVLLSFEIYDVQDSMRLFVASGPLEVIQSTESGLTALRLTGTKRSEVCRPFSAKSRDPVNKRFENISAYLCHSWRPDFPVGFRVRVVATDTRTGTQALIYNSEPKTKRSVKDSTLNFWRRFLPRHSLFVWEDWSRWVLQSGTQEAVEISTSFYVSPVQKSPVSSTSSTGSAEEREDGWMHFPSATGTSRQRALDQPHVIMGGDETAYANHNSFVAVQFRTLDASVPARYIKGALERSRATGG